MKRPLSPTLGLLFLPALLLLAGCPASQPQPQTPAPPQGPSPLADPLLQAITNAVGPTSGALTAEQRARFAFAALSYAASLPPATLSQLVFEMGGQSFSAGQAASLIELAGLLNTLDIFRCLVVLPALPPGSTNADLAAQFNASGCLPVGAVVSEQQIAAYAAVFNAISSELAKPQRQ